mmetsp:Transcript_10900/g.11972  ORF Transcript_10900/g.11972 Transcript_10900/m.11972 type:complete len:305 (+) Transcript_10900:30-944(+)
MTSPTNTPNITVKHEVASELMEPYRYIEERSGKGMRAKLIDAFNWWLKVPEPVLSEIKGVIDLLHNASLLIDDIEDNSTLRRGIPVAHAIFGVPNTINTSNYIYFLSMQRCTNLGSPEAVAVFIEELLNLHRGQGWDILWRDNNDCPTEEQYKQMVIDKTGGLFRLGTRILQCFSEDKTDYIPLLNKLGLFYQIRDDYINLQSEKYHENKSFAEDLTEGKFSFPIIHCIHKNPNDHRLLNILKRKPTDPDVKKHAIAFMAKNGSFEYTERVLDELKSEIFAILKELGGNDQVVAIIDYLEKHLI